VHVHTPCVIPSHLPQLNLCFAWALLGMEGSHEEAPRAHGCLAIGSVKCGKFGGSSGFTKETLTTNDLNSESGGRMRTQDCKVSACSSVRVAQSSAMLSGTQGPSIFHSASSPFNLALWLVSCDHNILVIAQAPFSPAASSQRRRGSLSGHF
jgi:hypothetical protein